MAEQKRDRAHSDGELDYDSLLSRYKDVAEPEPPPPPREKKKIISTLLSDVSAPGEGKFARKRGQKAAPQQKEPEEEPQAPPLKLEELKPAPRPQEGKKRWDRILREPVREEPPAGEELSQVLDSFFGTDLLPDIFPCPAAGFLSFKMRATQEAAATDRQTVAARDPNTLPALRKIVSCALKSDPAT